MRHKHEPLLIPCDMFDTSLCIHYRKQKDCHYRSTHLVKCLLAVGNEDGDAE